MREKTWLTIRFGFLHVLIVIFQTIQTNSCGKCWLKPGFTEFQTGLGGRGPVQSWLSPWCRCFSSLAVDILEIHGRSLTSAKVNPNMLISVISLQILSKFINISSIYHGYSVILDVGNIHEIHHLMFFRMTCHGWPPGNIPRNDGSFGSALVRQSHDHWPIGGTNSTKRRKWNIETTCLTDLQQLSPNWYFGRSSPNFDHF